MANALQDNAPGSAVARLFDSALAGQATARLSREPAAALATPALPATANHTNRECVLTPATDEAPRSGPAEHGNSRQREQHRPRAAPRGQHRMAAAGR